MAASTRYVGGFGLLVTEFARGVAGAAHVVVVSVDGALLAASEGLPQERAEQLCAVASGLLCDSEVAARRFEAGAVSQVVVEMQRGYLFLMSITRGSCLAVLATPTCDIGALAYEMTLLVERIAHRSTATMRQQLTGQAVGDHA